MEGPRQSIFLTFISKAQEAIGETMNYLSEPRSVSLLGFWTMPYPSVGKDCVLFYSTAEAPEAKGQSSSLPAGLSAILGKWQWSWWCRGRNTEGTMLGTSQALLHLIARYFISPIPITQSRTLRQAGEMDRWLRVFICNFLQFFPSTPTWGGSQQLLTLVPGKLLSFSGFCSYQHTCGIQIDIHTIALAHIYDKIDKNSWISKKKERTLILAAIS